MKTLEKAICTAIVEGKPWKQELYSFLRNYRATPHITTNKSPAELLFGRAIRTKVPQFDRLSPIDQSLQETDAKAKQKMKTNSDSKFHAKSSNIKVGDSVLLREKKRNKFSFQL